MPRLDPADAYPLGVEEDTIDVVCAGCGLTTTFSAEEPPERRVCPECSGAVSEACTASQGDDDGRS